MRERRASVKSIRNLLAPATGHKDPAKRAQFKPAYFMFCDRKTGASRFRVEAQPDGQLPLEHAASVLAIYCLAHHRTPQDFTLVFGAQDEMFVDVTARAATLLDAAGVYANPVGISRREQEVLRFVAESLCNKEIAARLCVSERTVKFHVSSLLAKLGARDRVELARFCSENSVPPAWIRSQSAIGNSDARNTPRELPETQLSEPVRLGQNARSDRPEKNRRMLRMPQRLALAVN
jgi:DNA-binding CsgD family transcriptional regulator